MRALTRSRDARAGLVTAVLGAGYLVAALQIEPDPSTTSVVGPQVAPLVIGVAIVVCSVALLVQGLRAPDRAAGHPEPAEDSLAPESPESPESAGEVDASARRTPRHQVLVTSAIFAAYIVAFIPVGYLLSTFAFLVAMTTYVDRSKLVRNCIYGALFAPIVYVLFNYGLQVQLPPGLLG
jgi:putative tricarboxylic transport membrane protein